MLPCPPAVTLRLKVFVLVAGVTLIPTIGITAMALWREVERGQEALLCEGATIAGSLAVRAGRWMGPQSPGAGWDQALRSMLDRALAAAPLERAWIVDANGLVLACADPGHRGCPPGVVGEFRPATGPVGALARLVQPVPLEARAVIVSGGAPVGAVRVVYRPESVVREARRLAGTAGIVSLLWIAAGLGLAMALVRRITGPLTNLVRAADTLAEGGNIEVAARADREVADLVRAFNRLSSRLRERRAERTALIESLNERVEQATRNVARTDRLATLGAIAAGFAHELGNSIHVVGGYATVALRGLPADHPNRHDVEAIRREAGRAAAMLERFLVFARVRTAHKAHQALAPIVREAAEVVGPAADQARVERTVDIASDLPPVNADAELLRQAFVNLCVNAVQAMEGRGGKLSVRARRDGDAIVIEVQDTGPGIAPELKPRIFEPFFTSKPNGTGLGLAIVRHAAEAHGGSVEVESEAGGGALFRVRLPAAVAPEDDGPAAPATGGAA